MRFINKSIFVFLFTAIIVVGFTQDAHAYIDPASGSYLLQFLLAGLLGGLFALKMVGSTGVAHIIPWKS